MALIAFVCCVNWADVIDPLSSMAKHRFTDGQMLPGRLDGVGVGLGVGVGEESTQSICAISLMRLGSALKSVTGMNRLGVDATERSAVLLIPPPTPMVAIVTPAALMAGATVVPKGSVLSAPSVISTSTLGLGAFRRILKHSLRPAPEEVPPRACGLAEMIFLKACRSDVRPVRVFDVVEKSTAEYLELCERAAKAVTMSLIAVVCWANCVEVRDPLSSMAKQRLTGGQICLA